MKFLLEFVTCSGSCSSEDGRPAAEEAKRLVVQEPRRRKQARASGDWRPSLTAISEDAMMAERKKYAERPAPAAEPGWRRSLRMKVSSMSQRDRSRSFDHDGGRRDLVPAMVMPAFAPTPFMF